MKILLGYHYFNHAIDVRQRVEAWLQRLRCHGFDVDGFVVTLNPPGRLLPWEELDRRWRRGDRELLELYERLARTSEGYDVFVNCNGNNIHPEFIRCLPTFNVYACFDDPESSSILSQPVAHAFDLCMVGNIACLDMYRDWGAKEVRWWPIGYHPNDHDPSLTADKIATQSRCHNVSLLCERESARRNDRLSKFVEAFPNGTYYGRGWPNGFLKEEQRVPLFQQTKIGPNFHNSIGPVNSRTFVLPANGVMQICDNQSHLSKIYELGKEVIGFDDIADAIDKARYYLAHDNERIEIAIAGWKRACKDYNEIAVFQKLIESVKECKKKENMSAGIQFVCRELCKRKAAGKRLDLINSVLKTVRTPLSKAKFGIKSVVGMLLKRY